MNVHSVSIKGLRDQNEDKHDIILNSENKMKHLKNVNFFGVYDGHGGKNVSNYIQKNISNFFLDKRINYPLSKSHVTKVFNNLQNSLMRYKWSNTSGTTCLVAVHFKFNESEYLNVLNTGDSRCILCRDNFAMPLTKDHKPKWPEEKHRIEGLGGKIVYDGYDWRIRDLSVSRAFGDLDATPFLTHTPDIFRYKLDKSDKFFVLACDGLWDVMSNFEVVNFILENCYDSSTKVRVNKKINTAKQLAQYALKKGSTDNITIIVVFLN
jgi:serine/threonine protein phosphatase PrpC